MVVESAVVDVEPRLAGRRVLVVEDEAMIAAFIETVLSDAGCSVIGPVATAGRALEAIERDGCDAVVLDICLNDERSYSLADALTARHVPFVIVSGLARADMPAGYRSCPYVGKPFRANALLAALDQMVGNY